MKYYFLLRKKYDKYPEIISSTKHKNKIIHMVLHYMEKEDIQSLVKKEDFKPYELKDGLVLVEDTPHEYLLYEVKNTGYVFNYYEWSKIDRLNVIEFDLLDDTNDDDTITSTMKELLVRYKEK